MAIPTMSTYDQYQKDQAQAIDQLRKKALDCVHCPTCDSQWFVEVQANRYQVNHNIILGQNVPEEPNTVPYILLRCVRCDEMLEPRILHNTRDVAGDRYDHFLDTMEGKLDSREDKQPKKPEEENAIQSEEL